MAVRTDRGYGLLGFLLCLALLVSGCGTATQAAGTKTISFAFQDFGGPVFMKWATGLKKQFEKAIQVNPDCTEALRELRILGKAKR